MSGILRPFESPAMQLTLIVGIVCGIAAVVFALQNNLPTTVTLALWQFEGSLALVLLLTLGLGALIAGLVSSPTVIRLQWSVARLTRRNAELEHRQLEQERQIATLTAELAVARAALPTAVGEWVREAPPPKPYVGLRSLLTGNAAPATGATPDQADSSPR